MKLRTRQEIADEFGISRNTLRNWLKKSDLEIKKGLISPKDYLRIKLHFGFSDGKDHLALNPDVNSVDALSDSEKIIKKTA